MQENRAHNRNEWILFMPKEKQQLGTTVEVRAGPMRIRLLRDPAGC